MRSSAVRLSVVVVAMALLAACTDNTTPRPSPSPSTSTARPSATTLEVSVYGGPDKQALYQQVVDAFTATRPGVTVHLVSYPTWRASERRLQAQAGTDAMPDVFLVDHTGLASLVQSESVLPLGEALVDRGLDFGDGYVRPAVVAFSADNDLQCMPDEVSPYVVFYNPRLVHLHQLARPGEAAPSAADGWTWTQFVRAARLAHRDGELGVYIPPSFDLFGVLVKAAGGRFVDNPLVPRTILLAGESSSAAVDRVLGLIRNPRLSLTRDQLDNHSPNDLFANGKLAMVVGTRDMVPQLRGVGMTFDVMPLPRITSTPSLTLMNGLCVSRTSNAAELATDFVAFTVGDEGATILARSGGVVPSNIDVIASDAFTISGVSPGNGFVFLDSLQRNPNAPYTPYWEAAQQVAAPYLDKIYYGPAEAVPSNLVGLVAKVTLALTPPEEPGS